MNRPNLHVRGFLTKTNLSFLFALLIILVTTGSMIFYIKDLATDNSKAMLIANTGKQYEQEIVLKNNLIKESVMRLKSVPPAEEVVSNVGSITELTRYLDQIFASYNTENSPFINSTLSFSDIREQNGIRFIEANMSISSSRDNFFRFLDFIENTGINRNQTSKLMEITSVNLNLEGSNTEEDLINYRVTIRIYYDSIS